MKAAEITCSLGITDASFNQINRRQSAFIDLVNVKAGNRNIIQENRFVQSTTLIELFDDKKASDSLRLDLPHAPDGTYDVSKVKRKTARLDHHNINTLALVKICRAYFYLRRHLS